MSHEPLCGCLIMCIEDMVRSTVALIYIIHMLKNGAGLVLLADSDTYNLMATQGINCRILSSGMMSHSLTLRQPREF